MDQEKIHTDTTIVALYHSVKSISSYLLQKWLLISLVVIAGGLLGILIAWLDKPEYESKLTFALEENDGALGGAFSLAAEFGISIGGSKNIFEGDNILTLLTSRTIVERVLLSVDTFNGKPVTMADYYLEISRDPKKKDKPKSSMSAKELRLNSVSYPVGLPRDKFTYLQDSVLFNLYKKFTEEGGLKAGKPDKKLNLFEVSVLSPEERFTKLFTDKLIKEATVFYTELKSRHSREILEILESRVAQIKGSLNTAIKGRAEIQDANVNPAFQQAQAQMQTKQVDISAYGGAYGELYKNLELARYQYLKDVPLLQVIDGAAYPMKKIKKGKLQTGLTIAILFGFLITFWLIIRKLFKDSLSNSELTNAQAP